MASDPEPVEEFPHGTHAREALTDSQALRPAVCPDWCCLPHSGVFPISHEGRSITVVVGCGDDGGEFFEVRTVQYLTQDFGTTYASESVPFVEVAHHVDGRYVLINLSTAQARALVHALVRSADAGDCTTGRDSLGSEDEE
jgi:hypothetical protein